MFERVAVNMRAGPLSRPYELCQVALHLPLQPANKKRMEGTHKVWCNNFYAPECQSRSVTLGWPAKRPFFQGNVSSNRSNTRLRGRFLLSLRLFCKPSSKNVDTSCTVACIIIPSTYCVYLNWQIWWFESFRRDENQGFDPARLEFHAAQTLINLLESLETLVLDWKAVSRLLCLLSIGNCTPILSGAGEAFPRSIEGFLPSKQPNSQTSESISIFYIVVLYFMLRYL